MKRFLVLITAACLFVPSLSIAAVYNDGDACAEAGAMHRKNDVTGFHYLICDGGTLLWKHIVTYEDDDQRVGIKVPVPLSPLHVTGGSAQPIVRIETPYADSVALNISNIETNRNSSIRFENAFSGGTEVAEITGSKGNSGQENSLNFSVTNTDFKLRQTNDGDVDTAAASLTYNVQKGAGGNDTGILINKTDSNSTGVSRLIDAQTDSVTQYWVDDEGIGYYAGMLGIANPSPDAELDVIGNIEFTGTITDVSDRRMKESIQVIDHALTGIRKLNGVSFVMKDDPSKVVELGLIAQDVQKAFPQLVKERGEGVLSLNYQGMIGPLVEAVKELDEENRKLKGLVHELDARLRVLEGTKRPPLKSYNH